MKIKNTYLSFLMASSLCLSCSNDSNNNTTTYSEENPLPGFLSVTGFNNKTITYIDDNTAYECGLEFTPTVNGNINAIVLKIPKTVNNIRVTIWDAETISPIRTEYVNVTVANANNRKNISPIQLTANHIYAITMNTHNYYIKHNDYQSVSYPITSGHIIINKTLHHPEVNQVLPTFAPVNAHQGDCSFIFQQTN